MSCTHLHADHVAGTPGWRTADSCRPSPTPVTSSTAPSGTTGRTPRRHSTRRWSRTACCPVIDAGLADLVAADHVIEDGVRLQHTPGHCSVLLGGGREEAIITGDLLHHPFRIAEPHRSSRVCHDPVLAARTRREFVERYADSDTLVLGIHFSLPRPRCASPAAHVPVGLRSDVRPDRSPTPSERTSGRSAGNFTPRPNPPLTDPSTHTFSLITLLPMTSWYAGHYSYPGLFGFGCWARLLGSVEMSTGRIITGVDTH